MKRKKESAIRTITIPRPVRDRRILTAELIESEKPIPPEIRERLIAMPLFYSRASDLEAALKERFTPARQRRLMREARKWASYWASKYPEDFPDEAAEAHRIFRRDFRQEVRQARIIANISICRCWVELLKRFPQYVDRCPWRCFQGDRIWQTLRDEELLQALDLTPRQLAEKMNLNAMSSADWDEVLHIVPELASRRPPYDYCPIIE